MQDDRPSRPAKRVAMRRAAHHLGDVPEILNDPAATVIIGAEAAWRTTRSGSQAGENRIVVRRHGAVGHVVRIGGTMWPSAMVTIMSDYDGPAAKSATVTWVGPAAWPAPAPTAPPTRETSFLVLVPPLYSVAPRPARGLCD